MMEEQGAKTEISKENESKADKFIRLGEYRVNKVTEAIGRLENLSNRSTYDYTPEQVETMFAVIERRISEVKMRFLVKKMENSSFSFDKKAE